MPCASSQELAACWAKRVHGATRGSPGEQRDDRGQRSKRQPWHASASPSPHCCSRWGKREPDGAWMGSNAAALLTFTGFTRAAKLPLGKIFGWVNQACFCLAESHSVHLAGKL